ncbi:MAG: hypothetical protein PHE24_04300 [Patescibacteria group bacterium]|nr:hypothetical protein [Patescibacteria group bacterium]
MQEIKKIKKLSLANIIALIYALFGFVASFSVTIYSLLTVITQKPMADKLLIYMATNLGLGFLIALAAALIAGIMGWLLGLVIAACYNYLARQIGGVKVELTEETVGEGTKEKPAFAKATAGKEKQELFKY